MHDEAEYFLDKLTCYDKYVEVYIIEEWDVANEFVDSDPGIEVNIIKLSYHHLCLLADSFRKNSPSKVTIHNGVAKVGGKFLHQLVINSDSVYYQLDGSEYIQYLNGNKLDNRLANMKVLRLIPPR